MDRDFLTVDEVDASSILKQFEAVLSKYDRSRVQEQVTRAYLNEQLNLTEYRMIDFIEEMETPDWFGEDFGGAVRTV
ncbi:hypothetical protein [Bacillus carboniphilus]|uniref:hypothetical protein n=1 Tax=Bacillus carboniphilus TaxID=86663 RepID=UPI0035320894